MPPMPASSFRGAVDSALVAAGLAHAAAQIRTCALRGTAVVRLIVLVDGRVSSAPFVREHLARGDKKCFLRVVSSLDFPSSGDTAELLVPFVFRAESAPSPVLQRLHAPRCGRRAD